MAPSTRERIISAALRLFGERGFAATSVAQIEQEAGLSGGSGALYRHFRSKDALLTAAVAHRLTERGAEWTRLLDPQHPIAETLAAAAPGGSTADRLAVLCRIGLDRLEHDRDVTRILLRDNSIDPSVLEVFRREEYATVMSVVTRALAGLAAPEQRDRDWGPTAAVVVGAISHFWLIRDIFGGDHPAAIDADSYLRATAELTAARLDWAGPEGEERS